jgi:hypothetical protein
MDTDTDGIDHFVVTVVMTCTSQMYLPSQRSHEYPIYPTFQTFLVFCSITSTCHAANHVLVDPVMTGMTCLELTVPTELVPVIKAYLWSTSTTLAPLVNAAVARGVSEGMAGTDWEGSRIEEMGGMESETGAGLGV